MKLKWLILTTTLKLIIVHILFDWSMSSTFINHCERSKCTKLLEISDTLNLLNTFLEKKKTVSCKLIVFFLPRTNNHRYHSNNLRKHNLVIMKRKSTSLTTNMVLIIIHGRSYQKLSFHFNCHPCQLGSISRKIYYNN